MIEGVHKGLAKAERLVYTGPRHGHRTFILSTLGSVHEIRSNRRHIKRKYRNGP